MEVDSVIEPPDTVVVRFNFPAYATGAGVEPSPVTPYGFVILPGDKSPRCRPPAGALSSPPQRPPAAS